jgi:hypothetical protein
MVIYILKTPYRDGTTQVALDPVGFVARLASLIPKPRVNLTRYHGILAPNHRWRGLVTPARRGKGVQKNANADVRTPAECHAAMTWAQRLKRVFNIDPNAARSRYVAVAVELSGSSRVLSPKTLSTAFWPACATRNPPPLRHHCYRAPDTTFQGTPGDIASFRREGRAVAEPAGTLFDQQGRH